VNRFCREVLLESLALCLLSLLIWLMAVTPSRPVALTKPGACCPAGKCDCDPEDCQCGKTKGLCCDGCSCAISRGGNP
jgi:hypothetical protein